MDSKIGAEHCAAGEVLFAYGDVPFLEPELRDVGDELRDLLRDGRSAWVEVRVAGPGGANPLR